MDDGLASFLVLVAVALIITAVIGRRDASAVRRNFFRRMKDNFGKAPVKEISEETGAHFPGYFSKHRSDGQIDDITWNDLEMDRVFSRLDYTQSAAGEEYLYWLLRTPDLELQCGSEKDPAAPSAAVSGVPMDRLSEDKIRYFQDHETERMDAQTVMAILGHSGKYSLYDYLDLLDDLGEPSNFKNYLSIILLCAAVASMFINTQIGIVALIAVLVFNMITYYFQKRNNDAYLMVFRFIFRLIDANDTLAEKKWDAWAEEIAACRALKKTMAGFRRGSGIMMSAGTNSGNPLDIALDYIRILLHLDLIKFNSMLRQVREKRAEIDRMIMLAGKIDAGASTACWRASLPYYAVPEFTAASFEANGLYHPLLDQPVANSISTDGWILLTGSNASGKSTFLKSAALCALLSQTLCTAPAESYRACRYRIYSSMALRDSLSSGESYFIVEIKSLKRILDAARDSDSKSAITSSAAPSERKDDAASQSPSPILCFIDEVLRGTNTVERIAASSEILLDLHRRGIRCFAATHDVELTSLLQGSYENYHFEEQIENGDVLFNYRLQKGAATTRNAIRLLEAIGYEEDIVKNAENRASEFIRSGEWKR